MVRDNALKSASEGGLFDDGRYVSCRSGGLPGFGPAGQAARFFFLLLMLLGYQEVWMTRGIGQEGGGGGVCDGMGFHR